MMIFKGFEFREGNLNYIFKKCKYVKTEKMLSYKNFFVLLRFNVNSSPNSLK